MLSSFQFAGSDAGEFAEHATRQATHLGSPQVNKMSLENLVVIPRLEAKHVHVGPLCELGQNPPAQVGVCDDYTQPGTQPPLQQTRGLGGWSGVDTPVVGWFQAGCFEGRVCRPCRCAVCHAKGADKSR